MNQSLPQQLREALDNTDVRNMIRVHLMRSLTTFRNLVPALLDRYEQLEREVERLKEYEWKYNDLCK